MHLVTDVVYLQKPFIILNSLSAFGIGILQSNDSKNKTKRKNVILKIIAPMFSPKKKICADFPLRFS